MADPLSVTIRVADYAPVKAVLDAANEVCDAQGDSPWTLSQAIDNLRETLDALTSPDDSGEVF